MFYWDIILIVIFFMMFKIFIWPLLLPMISMHRIILSVVFSAACNVMINGICFYWCTRKTVEYILVSWFLSCLLFAYFFPEKVWRQNFSRDKNWNIIISFKICLKNWCILHTCTYDNMGMFFFYTAFISHLADCWCMTYG